MGKKHVKVLSEDDKVGIEAKVVLEHLLKKWPDYIIVVRPNRPSRKVNVVLRPVVAGELPERLLRFLYMRGYSLSPRKTSKKHFVKSFIIRNGSLVPEKQPKTSL